jgi:hypothetical protein
MLLALRSLGGKSDGRTLRAAFSAIHPVRAARYRFSTRPEDFHSGLREVANSFIRPTGAQGFEVIDPSVLDLLNTVIRAAPDNAADIVARAAGFDQIEQVWTLAKAPSNGGLLAALGHEVMRLIPTVARLGIENRRIDLGSGTTGFRGPSYERRLTIIVEMAERLAKPLGYLGRAEEQGWSVGLYFALFLVVRAKSDRLGFIVSRAVNKCYAIIVCGSRKVSMFW